MHNLLYYLTVNFSSIVNKILLMATLWKVKAKYFLSCYLLFQWCCITPWWRQFIEGGNRVWYGRETWELASIIPGIGSWELTFTATSTKQSEWIGSKVRLYTLKPCLHSHSLSNNAPSWCTALNGATNWESEPIGNVSCSNHQTLLNSTTISFWLVL